jgi:hypothetical protein
MNVSNRIAEQKKSPPTSPSLNQVEPPTQTYFIDVWAWKDLGEEKEKEKKERR